MSSTGSGIHARLRYAALSPELSHGSKEHSCIVALIEDHQNPVYTAGKELQAGIQSILGQTLDIITSLSARPSRIVVGTLDSYRSASGHVQGTPVLDKDGYWLSIKGDGVLILGQNDRGAL